MDFGLLQSSVNANGTRRLVGAASQSLGVVASLRNPADPRLLEGRKGEVEGAALAHGAVHADLAAHLLDDHPHDG